MLGAGHPVRIQTMTTTDTMDIAATVAQTIRCIEAGAELVRITAPSKKEAEALRPIKEAVRAAGFSTPLVADIHFTPNAAEIAARIVEKVRVNPGNYVDKKKFDLLEYTDVEYAAEIERIRERFTPLVRICREWGTAMRIGTNHGSLSDRIMSRYGDTPIGMVESAMEFLRVARDESFHQIVLSMKSSNPQVMVQAYRLLVRHMQEEFSECYPLHLGVTEAGDGEDGRIKSAIGIGTLLEEGMGDTIRVSLTEDPEFEIPVCRDLVKKYAQAVRPPRLRLPANYPQEQMDDLRGQSFLSEPEIVGLNGKQSPLPSAGGGGLRSDSEAAALAGGGRAAGPDAMLAGQPSLGLYTRRASTPVQNIGGTHVPVVIADFSQAASIHPDDLRAIGYTYDAATDKWSIADAAADYIFLGKNTLGFGLPGTLRAIIDADVWERLDNGRANYLPLFGASSLPSNLPQAPITFAAAYLDADGVFGDADFKNLEAHATASAFVLCLAATSAVPAIDLKKAVQTLDQCGFRAPIVIAAESMSAMVDEQLIDFSTAAGSPLLDGIGDGVWLMNDPSKMQNTRSTGRTYLPVENNQQFLNNTAFSVLQATRTRISKTEYISCPSCGRTLFDLQETTAKIRAATHHLKGVKIAIMGCIVNGPGEMADADFGYVGSGPGKITLYRGRDVVKRSVDSEVAVEELILLMKDAGAWVEREAGVIR